MVIDHAGLVEDGVANRVIAPLRRDHARQKGNAEGMAGRQQRNQWFAPGRLPVEILRSITVRSGIR